MQDNASQNFSMGEEEFHEILPLSGKLLRVGGYWERESQLSSQMQTPERLPRLQYMIPHSYT